MVTAVFESFMLTGNDWVTTYLWEIYLLHIVKMRTCQWNIGTNVFSLLFQNSSECKPFKCAKSSLNIEYLSMQASAKYKGWLFNFWFYIARNNRFSMNSIQTNWNQCSLATLQVISQPSIQKDIQTLALTIIQFFLATKIFYMCVIMWNKKKIKKKNRVSSAMCRSRHIDVKL